MEPFGTSEKYATFEKIKETKETAKKEEMSDSENEVEDTVEKFRGRRSGGSRRSGRGGGRRSGGRSGGGRRSGGRRSGGNRRMWSRRNNYRTNYPYYNSLYRTPYYYYNYSYPWYYSIPYVFGNNYYEMPNDGYFVGEEEEDSDNDEETKGEEEMFDIGTLFKGNTFIMLVLTGVIIYLHYDKKK